MTDHEELIQAAREVCNYGIVFGVETKEGCNLVAALKNALPAPDAKPAQSEDAPPGVEWPPPGLETGGLNPPAPSEDEGEKWGRLLWELWMNPHRPGVPHDDRVEWQAQCAEVRAKYRATAAWFRDKVLAEAGLKTSEPEVVDEEPQTISLAPGASITFDVDGVPKFVVKADE